jgi:N-glycosylase/DNA lyase
LTQRAALLLCPITLQIELPAATDKVIPGVPWGSVDAFPTPAYWAYQVIAQRAVGKPVRYRLGSTLTEEVAACLLGGHGIPASVGVAAFHRLKSVGALEGIPTQEELHALLLEPLLVNGRSIRYRFARQKARYLSEALTILSTSSPPVSSGRALRDALLELPGVGYKTAAWIARNWLDADDVAILDIHILRAGHLAGFFSPGLSVTKDYLALEEQFLAFSLGLGVRASELDAVIWLEMATTSSVRHLMRPAKVNGPTPRSRRTHIRRPNSHQGSLVD